MSVKTVLEASEAALQALEKLQAMTRVGGDRAAEVLSAVDAGLGVLISWAKGEGAQDDALAALDKLHADLAAHDAAALASLDEKFPTG